MKTNEQHASLTSVRGRARPVLKGVRIRASATVPLLEVTAEQKYVNQSKKNLEIVYTFPVPPRAVLLGLEFTLGDRTLKGVVKAKQEALKDYDKAVEGGDSAVLVEAQQDGLYTANLGNLKAGEQATIRVTYGQLLEAQGDHWRITVPTVLAPFYGNPESDGGLDPRAAPTQSISSEYPLEFTLEIPGATAETVRCTSHDARLDRVGEALVATLPDHARLDRDVVFLVQRATEPTVLCGPDRERAVIVASTVLRPDEVEEAPVVVRLVLDCSGSMAGDSMDWASVGCQHLLEHLREDDEFSITRFGSSVDHWTPKMLDASASNRSTFARRLLDVTADLGGTEMEQALKAAAALKSERPRSEIVLLTDGEIWASDALVRWARGTGLRVFVIGVGAAPNQPFLARLAEETGGTCEFVTPGEDMIEALKRLLVRLRQPRRETLEVMWPKKPEWTLQLPAVAHAGQTVHLIAGFEAAPIGEATVGTTRVQLPGTTAAGSALSRVVAYQRLLSGHFAKPAMAAEEYQLVTEWTSLVAVLERAAADKSVGLPELAKVDHMLAAGWGGSGRVRHSMSSSAPTATLDMCMSYESVARFRTGDAADLTGDAVRDFEDGPIEDLLRPVDDELATPATPPTAEQVLAIGREVAMVRHREEISRWVRAINRRVLVESLSESPPALTLDWLGACVPSRVIDRMKASLSAPANEAAAVVAFIELLDSLGDELDESVSDRTRHWAEQRRASGADGDAYRELVRGALDDFLFEGIAPAPVRSAAGLSA